MRRWNAHMDLAEYNRWRGLYGQVPMNARFLSPDGFMVPDVAAGFLCRINGTAVGFIDGFVSNPAVPAEQRHRAMNEIIAALMEEARTTGVRRLCVFSADDGLSERCRSAGGTHDGYREAWYRDIGGAS